GSPPRIAAIIGSTVVGSAVPGWGTRVRDRRKMIQTRELVPRKVSPGVTACDLDRTIVVGATPLEVRPEISRTTSTVLRRLRQGIGVIPVLPWCHSSCAPSDLIRARVGRDDGNIVRWDAGLFYVHADAAPKVAVLGRVSIGIGMVNVDRIRIVRLKHVLLAI